MSIPSPEHYSHILLASPFGGGQETVPVWVQPQSLVPPSYVIDPYSPYKLPSSWPLPSPLSPDTGLPPSQIGRPAPLILDTWDQTSLARRPRDWRAGYNPRGSFLSNLLLSSSLSKNQSDIQEYKDPIKRRLTSSLEYDADQPPVMYDLRHNPFDPMNPIFHARNGHRNTFNELDMAQFATIPTARFLRLFHPKLPWYIDIGPFRPNGITVDDILLQLSTQLRQQILPRHYWNDALSQQDRNEIGKAYMRRSRLWESDQKRGILWIDFLCDEVVFEGLVRAKGGTWEIRTRNTYV